MHEIVKRNSLVPLVLKNCDFWKKVTLFLKNNTLKKIDICLINRINKFCTFYMIAHSYRFHMWLEREKNILPLFFKIMTSGKKIFYFFKNMTFWKMHLFINLDQRSMKILYDRTFLYMALTIGVSNLLVLFFLNCVFYGKLCYFLKNMTFYQTTYFY